MTDCKYFPLFYNWFGITKSLSDEDFGILIRALMRSATEDVEVDSLPESIRVAFLFMLDNAMRTYDNQRRLSETRRDAANQRWRKNDAQTGAAEKTRKPRYGDFDPEEALKLAIERSAQT